MITLIITRRPKETALLVNRLLLRNIPFTLSHTALCDSEFQFTEAAWLRIHSDRAVLHQLGYHFRFEAVPSAAQAQGAQR